MNRRDFIRHMGRMAAAAAVAPFFLPRAAAAAWQTGGSGSAGVHIRETHLRFRSLENRDTTDVIILHHIGNTNADVSAATVHRWHLANGWAGIGYHYVIRKDAAVHDVRFASRRRHHQGAPRFQCDGMPRGASL